MVALRVPQFEPEGQVFRGAPYRRLVPVAEPLAKPPVTQRRLSRMEGMRRRRLAVLVAGAVLVTATMVAVEALTTEASSGAPVRPLSSVDESTYVVQPGDTLWVIAQRLAPGADPRPLVAELRSRHGGVELQVGDRLRLDGLVG